MKRFAVLALGTMIAAPAFAGGPVVVAEEPIVAAPAPIAVVEPVTGDWAGGYAGVQLGYGSGGDTDGDGALGGVHAGYRWDLGRTVLGVQGDYNAADVKGSNDSIEMDKLYSLKGQAGYDLGRTLVYATAGVAKADLDVGGAGYSDTGWTAGVGVDYAVNQNWTVGGELSTYSFGDFDDSGVVYDPTTVQVKASYNF